MGFFLSVASLEHSLYNPAQKCLPKRSAKFVRYVSTRGQAPKLGFTDVVTTGLASDGGLYVPESWPRVSPDTMRQWCELSYADLAVEIIQLFAGDTIARDELTHMSAVAYSKFAHPAIAPMIQLDERLWLMELFHGPTLAFKDFALQFLGQLFDYLLEQTRSQRTIIGATSGDTGSAAIEAIRGLRNVRVFMLHPKNRVSDVQRRQMTTVTESNVFNIAVEGNFDDCQRLVKQMFNDAVFRDEMRLSAVNSINWARVAAQIVYYFKAGLNLGAPDRSVSFSVPSGNFGNVFAGYAAKQMGLPVAQFVVGSNHNDILTRFFNSGEMKVEGVEPSITPSMDIQVSSNFERQLFELTQRDSSEVTRLMNVFAQAGVFRVSDPQFDCISKEFVAGSLSDEQTRAEMRSLYKRTGYLIDPHSAIGVATARQINGNPSHSSPSVPMVVLATAHPAKFPQAVLEATGIEATLPERLQHIMHATESLREAPAELAAIQAMIRAEPWT